MASPIVKNKKEREKEASKLRKLIRVVEAEQRKIDLTAKQAALVGMYDILPWARTVLPRGTAPVELDELPQTILDAFDPHLKHIETGRNDPFTGQPLYRFISYQSGKKDVKGGFVFRGFAAVVRSGVGGTSLRVGLSERSPVLAAIMALAALFDQRLQNLASNTSWLLWLVEGGEKNATLWLADPNVRAAIMSGTPIPQSGGRPGGDVSAARNLFAVASGV